ncbi:MAG: hypothetical protein IT305_30375 [Chloroflexi bacterium]|nr:hypothetical protein [Chloroflexota bacterium]
MGFLDKLFGGGKGASSDGDPQAALNEIVTLYDVPDVKADGGIAPTSRQATEIRDIGKKLYKAGGKPRMLEVRDGLRQRLPWAVQNLETIWGGTKEWQG